MADNGKIKVVFVGRDALTDSIFNIVKIGVYDMTEEGCISALRDGILDKYKREAPEFKCLAFDKNETFVSDDKEHSVFVFSCFEYDIDNTSIATLISGRATYSRNL